MSNRGACYTMKHGQVAIIGNKTHCGTYTLSASETKIEHPVLVWKLSIRSLGTNVRRAHMQIRVS
jgi:hypothetical protein